MTQGVKILYSKIYYDYLTWTYCEHGSKRNITKSTMLYGLTLETHIHSLLIYFTFTKDFLSYMKFLI